MNEKNVRTTLDNTADDIQEARDDNGCDDAEEEDDNEDEEHGEGPGMLQQEWKTRWSSTHADTCYGWHVAAGMQDEVDIHACYE